MSATLMSASVSYCTSVFTMVASCCSYSTNLFTWVLCFSVDSGDPRT